jgi:hypothetical protein
MEPFLIKMIKAAFIRCAGVTAKGRRFNNFATEIEFADSEVALEILLKADAI